MERPGHGKSRKPFRLWTGHDLADHGPEFASSRPEFYGGLRQGDEAVVWKFIVQNHLRKYRCFLRADFDWMADGLGESPFPGSVSMGVSVSPENYGMPRPSAARIHAWRVNLDAREPVGEVGHEDLDYEASDGGAVELEVPRFITDLAL